MGNVGFWTGLNQTTGQALSTGMKLMEYAGEQRHRAAVEANQAAQLQIQKDQAEMQDRLFKVQVEQAEKNTALVPIDETLSRIGFTTPEEHKLFKEKTLLHVENIGGVDYIQRGKGTELFQTFSQDPVFNIELGTIKTNNLNKGIDAIKSQFADPEISGKMKPEQRQSLEAQYNALIDERTKIANAMKNEQGKLRARNKELMVRMQDPDTGEWFEVNSATGERFSLGKLTPETIVKEKMAIEGKKQEISATTAATLEAARIRERGDIGRNIKGDQKFAMSLRKEFNALQPVKDYRDVTTKYNVMQEAFKESKTTKNFVAVDQALVTLYNKMTDPQSVVRESEYIRTPQDMAILDRARAAMARVFKGGRLEPDTRQTIMTMAGKFKEVYDRKYNEIANQYRDYAGSAGIEPGNVVKPTKEPTRDISRAVSYLKTAKNREDAKKRMRSLMSASGLEGNWTEEELREVERQAGY
jgi:hypothetical protein